MTFTWKVDDTYYRFVDGIDRLDVQRVIVKQIAKLYSVVHSVNGGYRRKVYHEEFLKEYATTPREAVNLCIQNTERQARFYEGRAKSERTLATSYKKYILEMKE